MLNFKEKAPIDLKLNKQHKKKQCKKKEIYTALTQILELRIITKTKYIDASFRSRCICDFARVVRLAHAWCRATGQRETRIHVTRHRSCRIRKIRFRKALQRFRLLKVKLPLNTLLRLSKLRLSATKLTIQRHNK